MLGQPLEVEMWKKRYRRETHFEVRMHKTIQVRNNNEKDKVHRLETGVRCLVFSSLLCAGKLVPKYILHMDIYRVLCWWPLIFGVCLGRVKNLSRQHLFQFHCFFSVIFRSVVLVLKTIL